MSELIELSLRSDVTQADGRGQLQRTFERIVSRLLRIGADVEKVKEADKIVRPVPIEEFPVAAGQIYTGAEGGNVGDVTWRAVLEAPPGTLECDGSAVSRTAFADLFGKIGTTYGAGDGSTTFNLPNLQRRTLRGRGGTGTGTLGSTVGSAGGAETHTLATSEIPAHQHNLAAHTHDMTHNHTYDAFDTGVGSVGAPAWSASTDAPNGKHSPNTSQHAGSTGAPSNDTSGSTGGGGAHNNMAPSLVMAAYVRYRLGPADVIQTAPIGWGRVNGQWRLDTVKNFPTTDIENLHEVVTAEGRPEALVKIEAAGGTVAGNSTENKIVFVMPIPYNFRRWRPEGIKVRTRVEMTGAPGSSSATVTLRVNNPNAAGAYLDETDARTIAESAGVISDGEVKLLQLSAEDLGRDWKPGYMLRVELLWSVPRTFTLAELYIGFLGIYM